MKAHAALPIRILTHNIRYATSSPFEGEKPWSERKHLIVNELKYNTAHNPAAFVCLQEVLHEQLVDILEGLNSSTSACRSIPAAPGQSNDEDEVESKEEWTYIGVGRSDGAQAGEYSPILFRSSIWSVSRWNTVWLSPTPDQPGKGWDAGSIRIVTIGHFVHTRSKNKVVGLCTHFDNAGAVSRRESAIMIQRILRRLAAEDRGPVWLAGDLNSDMDGEAYGILNAEDSLLRDSRALAVWRYGNEITCTGFRDEEMTVIDYVFVGRQGWSVEGFSVLANRFEDGVYSSDHRAVVVDAVLDV